MNDDLISYKLKQYANAVDELSKSWSNFSSCIARFVKTALDPKKHRHFKRYKRMMKRWY